MSSKVSPLNAGQWHFVLPLSLCALLIFIWPIPGTIALRNVFAAVLLGALLVSSWRERLLSFARMPGLYPVVGSFALLSGWVLLVVAGWAVEPATSWREFWAQWSVPTICGFMGYLLARLAMNRGEAGKQAILKVIFFTLLFQVTLHDLLDFAYLISTGEQPYRQAPVLYLPVFLETWQTGEPWTQAFLGRYFEKFSFVNNTFAAILIAEVLQRTIQKKPWLNLPNWLLAASFFLVLLCSYWLRVRNGNLGLLFLLIVAGLMTLIKIHHRWKASRLIFALGLALAILTGIGTAFWKTDARWQTFVETVPIALDTDTHKAWLSRSIAPYPRLSNGNEVDPSNYERLAWIKEGLKLGWERPFGSGLNRSGFFDGLDRKYQMNGALRGGHSHSGIVDFFIANGVPGLLLWFAFLLSITVLGWKTFAGANMALGLMLIFLISGFFSRSLVDSNIRDHVFQQFLFMAGIFATLCAGTIQSEKGKA